MLAKCNTVMSTVTLLVLFIPFISNNRFRNCRLTQSVFWSLYFSTFIYSFILIYFIFYFAKKKKEIEILKMYASDDADVPRYLDWCVIVHFEKTIFHGLRSFWLIYSWGWVWHVHSEHTVEELEQVEDMGRLSSDHMRQIHTRRPGEPEKVWNLDA